MEWGGRSDVNSNKVLKIQNTELLASNLMMKLGNFTKKATRYI